jgi:uncharacterized protein
MCIHPFFVFWYKVSAMIVLLSPAKIQNFKPEPFLMEGTQPLFLKEAEQLVAQIRSLSISGLAEMLHINFDLARLNAERLSIWKRPFTSSNAKPTVQVFNGEVFHGLDIRSFPAEMLPYLQVHLRIFSGLYGLLRPFDLIQPYRLDFGDSFKTSDGQNLYQYWSKKITTSLNKALDETQGPRIVLNLASGEYIKGIDKKKLKATIVDVDFLQFQPQGYKTIVVYTKKARGMMTRFVLEHQIQDTDSLKAFDSEGYLWHPGMSSETKITFTR